MTVLTWSDDRVEQPKKLWENGLSASQIAEELGNVTRNADDRQGAPARSVRPRHEPFVGRSELAARPAPPST